MDHGKLTDSNGKTIDFRNVILIMTTNAGAADLSRTPIGFTHSKHHQDYSKRSIACAPKFATASTPWCLAVCRRKMITRIVDEFVVRLEARLADRDVTIDLSDEARAWLVGAWL